jgi:hypothetical protein
MRMIQKKLERKGVKALPSTTSPRPSPPLRGGEGDDRALDSLSRHIQWHPKKSEMKPKISNSERNIVHN